jgi:hypothetical protein
MGIRRVPIGSRTTPKRFWQERMNSAPQLATVGDRGSAGCGPSVSRSPQAKGYLGLLASRLWKSLGRSGFGGGGHGAKARSVASGYR